MKSSLTHLIRSAGCISFFLLTYHSTIAQTISTIAGRGAVTGMQGTQYSTIWPAGIARDASGNTYVADYDRGNIAKITTDGTVSLFAGSLSYLPGNPIPDGNNLNAGSLRGPVGLCLDAAGNVYVCEDYAGVVRKITPGGVISTYAGNGSGVSGGDGGPATSAGLFLAEGLAIDAAGNLYIAEYGAGRVRKVSTNGIITTVATGVIPWALYATANGNVYIVGSNAEILLLNTAGILSTVAVGLPGPYSVYVDPAGNVYAGCGASIVLINPSGVTSTVAGTGIAGYSGDGGPATSAQLSAVWGITGDGSGNIYFSDETNERVRKINASGIITTIAGNGLTVPGAYGPATNVPLLGATAIFADTAGNIYFPSDNHVLQVTPSGILTNKAGTSAPSYYGDGSPDTAATLDVPYGVYKDPAGNIYVGDNGDNHIRKINPSGTITTFAGNGTQGYTGDGGLATSAEISSIQGIIGDAAGNIYFTDFTDQVVRKITPGGVVSTFAGNGTNGLTGDGGTATAAELNSPHSIGIDAAGNIYIAGDLPNAVRKVTPEGIISTVAGSSNTNTGNSGDGAAATSALFGDIEGLWVDAQGDLYIVDAGNNRVRRVDASTGIITAFAGNGTQGFAGDGGAALAAEFSHPWAATGDPQGNLLVADSGNNRIRKVTIHYTLATANTSITQDIENLVKDNINDPNFNRIVSITSTPGSNPARGVIAFTVAFDPSVQTFQNIPYVTRHYDITPSSNAASAQAAITLYYLQSEFDAYNTYISSNSLALPLLPTGGIDNGNVQINQFHGTGTAPGNYTGSELLITPAVTWNATYSWWELTFPVNGFSGFFVTTGGIPLPLELLSFTGTLQNGIVNLNWQTTDEVNTQSFVVQRSTNGVDFTDIGTVTAKDQQGKSEYGYPDTRPVPGTDFYRLKMLDQNGHATYSNIVAMSTSATTTAMSIFPNPVKDQLFVQLTATTTTGNATLRLVDMDGNVLQKMEVVLSPGINSFTFNTASLVSGAYMVTNGQTVIQFIKK
jgi:hypothetical protein